MRMTRTTTSSFVEIKLDGLSNKFCVDEQNAYKTLYCILLKVNFDSFRDHMVNIHFAVWKFGKAAIV